MNRYLFLDIDGVLNSMRSHITYQKMVLSSHVKYRIDSSEPLASLFDPLSVGLLKEAQKALGFQIVISSTWRTHLTVHEFHLIFDDYGWDTRGIIIGKTGHEPVNRGRQIKSWMNEHAKYPSQYCILDDSSDMLVEQEPFFVHTNLNDGLDWDSFMKIFRAFGEHFEEDKLIVSC